MSTSGSPAGYPGLTTLIKSQWVNWKFLWTPLGRNAVLPTTTPLFNTANVDTEVNVWDIETFRIKYDRNEVGFRLPAAEYEEIKEYDWVHAWKGVDNFSQYDTGEPSMVCVLPDNRLLLDSIPDDTMYLTGDYYRTAIRLAKNTDVTEIPAGFQGVRRAGFWHWCITPNFRNLQELRVQGAERFQEGHASA